MSTIMITLPSEIETALSGEAERLGTTPELLAARILHERFEDAAIPEDQGEGITPDKPEPKNLAEFLGDFIGCVDSSHGTGKTSNLSERTGDAFAEILQQKRREGRL
jgi:hypothetical protein